MANELQKSPTYDAFLAYLARKRFDALPLWSRTRVGILIRQFLIIGGLGIALDSAIGGISGWIPFFIPAAFQTIARVGVMVAGWGIAFSNFRSYRTRTDNLLKDLEWEARWGAKDGEFCRELAGYIRPRRDAHLKSIQALEGKKKSAEEIVKKIDSLLKSREKRADLDPQVKSFLELVKKNAEALVTRAGSLLEGFEKGGKALGEELALCDLLHFLDEQREVFSGIQSETLLNAAGVCESLTQITRDVKFVSSFTASNLYCQVPAQAETTPEIEDDGDSAKKGE